MRIEEALQSILAQIAEMKNELAEIRSQLNYLASPLATVSVDEKAKAVKAAMATGDKRILRETLNKINGITPKRPTRKGKAMM